MKLIGAILVLFTSTLAQASYNYQCGQFMADVMTTEKYGLIRTIVPFNKKSSDLTPQEKLEIELTKKVLRQTADHFNEVYNRLFAPLGTKFLPQLKSIFEKEEQQLRQKNQIIINELQRYLDDRSDLSFRSLDILQVIAKVKSSWAMRFIQDPNEVYFNLNFFFVSRLPNASYEDGYVFASSSHPELVQDVYLLDSNKADSYTDSFYPGSNIYVSRLQSDQKLVFPGLPLTKNLIDFLVEHGNAEGKIRVVAQPIGAGRRTLLSNFFPEKHLPLSNARWSSHLGKYHEILNEDDSVNLSLSNISNYYENKNHLVVPTLPASWEEMKQGLFSPRDMDKRRLNLRVVSPEIADIAVAPSPFEFLTAFIELYNL